jgi:hypothetical protein
VQPGEYPAIAQAIREFDFAFMLAVTTLAKLTIAK